MFTIEATQITTFRTIWAYPVLTCVINSIAWASQCGCTFTGWRLSVLPSCSLLIHRKAMHPQRSRCGLTLSFHFLLLDDSGTQSIFSDSFPSLGPMLGLLTAMRKGNRLRVKSLGFRISYIWLSLRVWTWVSCSSLFVSVVPSVKWR